MDQANDWHVVCDAATLKEDEPFGTKVGDTPVALFRLPDGVYATHDLCTHANALLSGGFIEGDAIECPLHEGRFDIRTGKCLARPAKRDVQTFPVKIENGKVLVQVSKTDSTKAGTSA